MVRSMTDLDNLSDEGSNVAETKSICAEDLISPLTLDLNSFRIKRSKSGHKTVPNI